MNQKVSEAAVANRTQAASKATHDLVTGWRGVRYQVADVARSIEFYTSFCKLSVLRDRRHEGGGTVWLGPTPSPGARPIFLLVIGEGEVKSRMDHLGFQCGRREDVDQIAERGRQLRILDVPPTDAGVPVGYFTIIRDPDGHLVEFTYGQPIEGLT